MSDVLATLQNMQRNGNVDVDLAATFTIQALNKIAAGDTKAAAAALRYAAVYMTQAAYPGNKYSPVLSRE